MICHIERRKNTVPFRLISAFVNFTFIVSLVIPPQLQAQTLQLNLPVPGTMVSLSPAFTPTLLKGITVHPEDPLKFDFIINKGDDKLNTEAFKTESEKLVKYFLAALTLPEDDVWVNLSPYEKDKIAPEKLSATDLGQDLLAQDYILKQLTASLIYPENDLGKKFWDKVYKKAKELYGTTEIPVNTFNKVWIMPDKAVVYEHNGTAFTVESHLKVMLEEDYLALSRSGDSSLVISGSTEPRTTNPESRNKLASEIVREIILPAIEEEVNRGKNFAQLRQIYEATILATWFKVALKESLLGKVYVDKGKILGIDSADKGSKEKIYQQYLEAYKKGVYNYIKKDYDPATEQVVARKYISGGVKTSLHATNLQPGDDILQIKDLAELDLADNPSTAIAAAILNAPSNIVTIKLNEPNESKNGDNALLAQPLGATKDGHRAFMMNPERFGRIRPNLLWTPEEIADIAMREGVADVPGLGNELADKLFKMMTEAQANGGYIPTGGVVDGPSAAAMAEAGILALYFSGWQMSYHWGQPDLAKYPLDTIPNQIEQIYKFLQNKDQDQSIRSAKIKAKLDEAFTELFQAIKDPAFNKHTFVDKLVGIVRSDVDIFVNDVKYDERLLPLFFEDVIAKAMEQKDNTSQKSRDAVRNYTYDTLGGMLVNYIIPIFADGDTGHQSVKEMMRLYVKAKAAAIHFEDQAHGLKKCGHMAGKVLVSTAEHLRRLMEARKEADKLSSSILVVARTDAESAKLLASNEDARDHYFIKGTTNQDIPSLAYLIRLSRREVDEFDRRADNPDVKKIKRLIPGINEGELKNILSSKTPDQLVDELAQTFPDLAAAIREVWRLRGEVDGRRLSPTMSLTKENGDFITSVEDLQSIRNVNDLWLLREAIEFGEIPGVSLETKLKVGINSSGESTYTVQEIFDRKPAILDREIAAMERLSDLWGQKANLKTYAQAVGEAILQKTGRNQQAILEKWEQSTDPLKNTLSLQQMQALAKTFGVEINWNWEPARTYEGYYQLDNKLGLINASMRSRVFAQVADVSWMEQEKPDVKQAAAFTQNVNADSKAKGVLFAINLSPSFNWFNPDNWKSSLTVEQVDNIKKAMKFSNFDWDDAATWRQYASDVQAMLTAITDFSENMGKTGFSFQFVTIFQDHVSTLAMFQAAKRLKEIGAGGFARYVQKPEGDHGSRFLRHQTGAGVNRVEGEDDVLSRGSSATGAGGKQSTEHQFRPKGGDNALLADAPKRIYFFGDNGAEGNGSMKDALGGKGANLAEMAKLGMPVPPGFTITTAETHKYLNEGNQFPDGLQEEVDASLARLEKIRGKKLGDSKDPLLVSVRSGAKFSMPGMMDTILNLGLNDASVEGLAEKTGNPRFAYDSYRRLIEMYGDVVLGVKRSKFTTVLNQLKQSKGLLQNEDDKLTADDFKYLAAEYKKIVKEEIGQDFPQDPREQLRGAIEAVFKSSNNERAIIYRRINNIPADVVSAVNVQSMVFGNTGEKSATGVAFSRDSSTGKKGLNGEFLINAQGEDVVAGIRKGLSLEELKRIMPRVYDQLLQISNTLEQHAKDFQDMEFTIEDGKLYMLQTRNAKRSAQSMLRSAVEMAEEGLITKEEALLRIDLGRIEAELMHPIIDPKAIDPKSPAAVKSLAEGTAGSPGAAVGKVVFNSHDAEAWAKNGEKVILVRTETSPEDLGGMVVSQGILTAQGGSTSHAALVARSQGIPAVVGVGALNVNSADKQFQAGETIVREGDWVTIDGATGKVYLGQLPTVPSEIEQVQNGTMKVEDSLIYQNYAKLLQWADATRTTGVWANVDAPEDAKRARELGAEGVGLDRTEHMFLKPERLLAVQSMFLAKEGSAERESLLREIGDMQQGDFEGILEAMQGLPVTIRLLDPPLHEFLPNSTESDYVAKIQVIAERLGVNTTEVEKRIKALREANPMLGSRGVRVAILNPSIIRMQAQAMIRAYANLVKRGVDAQLKIMVPNVAKVAEFIYAKKIIQEVENEILDAQGLSDKKAEIKIGTMIEIPSAALTADKIAEEADFFSFGTNDLTQFALGMSRDDAAKSFLGVYLQMGIFEADPTQKLDPTAVYRLIKIAVEDGRRTNPSLNIGVCGEHGGEPSSIDLFIRAGLNYVSASPLRIPIARLASAQTAIKLQSERKSGDGALLASRVDASIGNVMEAYNDVLNPQVAQILDKVAPLSEELSRLRETRETRYIDRQLNSKKIDFLPETNPDGSDAVIPGTNITVKDARVGKFEGAPIPKDLQRQWIQLTGPAAKSPQDKIDRNGTPFSKEQSTEADLRNVIHALLSGADGMMFDGEDALGQLDTMSLDNIRALTLTDRKSPTLWKVAEQVANEYITKNKKPANWNWKELIEKNFTTRIYRVRGLHLDDRHIQFTNSLGTSAAVSATIVDMVAYLVNAGPVLMSQGSTPTLYLPKLQTAEEAAFMAKIIDQIEDQMGWERGTVKVFVLIEQLEETFQLMEMRAALGKHFVGFNTGRWDYIADVVKQNMWDNNWVPPNFKEMVMTYPFMLNYEGRVVRAVNTPDKNGNTVLWIGGMEPQIPVVKGEISAADKDAAIENAMKIAEGSKLRELKRGASGTWVAHPGMVERLRQVYERNLFEATGKVNQLDLKENLNGEEIDALQYTPEAAAALTELKPGARTIAELRFLVSVAMQYANAYLTGRAAAALKGADLFPNPLALFIMEDMATGEGRSKLTKKWINANAEITEITEDDRKTLGLQEGDRFTPELVQRILAQEYQKLQNAPDDIVFASSKKVELPIARMIVDKFLFSNAGRLPALPWLIDLTNMALGEKDLAKATKKVDTYIKAYKETGGLVRLTENPDFKEAGDVALLANRNGAYSFSPGPAMLPTGVLAEAALNTGSFRGTGVDLSERTYRIPEYLAIHQETIDNFRKLLKIPANYKIILQPRAASDMYGTVPLNLLGIKGTAYYVNTDLWTTRAINDAREVAKSMVLQRATTKLTDGEIDRRVYAAIRVIATSEDKNLNYLPTLDSSMFEGKAGEVSYVYLGLNNTTRGTRWATLPDTKGIPLVLDATSDLLSQPIDWNANIGVVFAGAQKNFGFPGFSVTIVREDLLGQALPGTFSMIDWKTQVEANSMWNTPPTADIYLTNLVLRDLIAKGGVEAIEKVNRQKAKLLYDTIDGSDGFYKGTAINPKDRSIMNVTFTLPSAELTDKFVTEAAKQGLLDLKGYPAVGGIRASIYNGMPMEGVVKLRDFMVKFAEENRGGDAALLVDTDTYRELGEYQSNPLLHSETEEWIRRVPSLQDIEKMVLEAVTKSLILGSEERTRLSALQGQVEAYKESRAKTELSDWQERISFFVELKSIFVDGWQLAQALDEKGEIKPEELERVAGILVRTKTDGRQVYENEAAKKQAEARIKGDNEALARETIKAEVGGLAVAREVKALFGNGDVALLADKGELATVETGSVRLDPKLIDGMKLADGSTIKVYRNRADYPDDAELMRHWDNHYAVFQITNEKLGYTAFMSFHRLTQIKSGSPVLDGQWRATGGTRIRQYATDEEAFTDALELSKEMSYKNAGGQLAIGGNKCAIRVNFDPTFGKADEKKVSNILASYARAIEEIGRVIGGGVLTGQDMNITVPRAKLMFENAPTSIVPYVSSLSKEPTPPTAVGVMAAIETALPYAFGAGASLNGKVVAIQGLGGVGGRVLMKLLEAGATVVAAEISKETIALLYENNPGLRNFEKSGKFYILKEANNIYNPAAGVDNYEITERGANRVDIFVPAAGGSVLNDETIPQLKAVGIKLVAGPANNASADSKKHPQALKEAGILYVPDYITNAGGVIAVDGHLGHAVSDVAIAERVSGNVKHIIEAAQAENTTPQVVADREALQFINQLVHAPSPDGVMLGDEQAEPEDVGGINLSAKGINLQIKRDANGTALPVNMQSIETINIEGFVPIIINIRPIPNLPLLLGINNFNPNQKTSENQGNENGSSINAAYLKEEQREAQLASVN